MLLLAGLILLFFLVLRYLVLEKYPLNSQQFLKIGNLKFYLKMKKTVYHTGENIDLKLRMKNMGKTALALDFANKNEYDFIIQREINTGLVRFPVTVWSYSASNVRMPKKRTVILKPGEEKIYSGVWKQRNFKNEIVPPGKYLINGIVNIVGAKVHLTLRGKTQ